MIRLARSRAASEGASRRQRRDPQPSGSARRAFLHYRLTRFTPRDPLSNAAHGRSVSEPVGAHSQVYVAAWVSACREGGGGGEERGRRGLCVLVKGRRVHSNALGDRQVLEAGGWVWDARVLDESLMAEMLKD